MITDINSEDRLVQETFENYLRDQLGWESVYAWHEETFGANGTLGRTSEREVVLVRDLRAALARLNPALPEEAITQAVQSLTRYDFSRSLLQHNQAFYKMLREGVPVQYRDSKGKLQKNYARVIDFRNGTNAEGQRHNRFLCVREMKMQGLRVPYYNRRADLICFVNGLPLVFFELKAVYRNIRLGFDNNLTDYMTEQVLAHAFYHNAFLVVSNGDRGRYGSITSPWEHFYEWKRNAEQERGEVQARTLLDGMLGHERLLDIVENFILFDESKPGKTRKVVARNHQVLGVNNAVAAVLQQEALKLTIPVAERLRYRAPKDLPSLSEEPTEAEIKAVARAAAHEAALPLIERAHPDLGRLGVFWHTQGSGKSYSMAFFVEKVRRVASGSFTFVIMTDREELDEQIYGTFVGTGIADQQTPRAGSAKELEKLLKENHRFIFTLIQKFRREAPPTEPYSRRDDLIVISDEAHRTQAGKLARNLRLALPNAAFLGFTGTPLFKYDHLTRRIFGNYVSRYDFKRSEEDGSTVRLVYENRGEKLGLARLDLNDRIAEKVEEAELDPDQVALLEKLLGKDYEVITADDRLDKIAADFVEHCSARWEMGKSMLVCVDKVTCGRMYQRIMPRWQAKIAQLQNELAVKQTELTQVEAEAKERLQKETEQLDARIAWMASTQIAIIISEAQNEVKEFAKWNFDITPHRHLIKTGFVAEDGKTMTVKEAFKSPEHPFRIAIVCAMWLTGFDVECLATLYLDKPLKAHTLMQAIARANRVYPGKDCGVIVDYNGMLGSLRAALAQYALGDESESNAMTGEGGEVVASIEEYVAALVQALEATEQHLMNLGFEVKRLIGTTGFARIQALSAAVEVLYTSDEAKRRFEIMARQVFQRFKILVMEPSALAFAERHDNLAAIYKKLEEKRDHADVTALLKELHRIVNAAIQTQGAGEDHAESLKIDLSQIDFARLREEFAQRARHKNTTLQDLRELVEKKLLHMLARNPSRMDYYRKYQEIIADYNREKDRVTAEDTFVRLLELHENLNAEELRAVKEGLTEDEQALFDLLEKENMNKAERERLKQASKSLLLSVREQLATMRHWTQNVQTQAEVEVLILDHLHEALPMPPYTSEETKALAERVYQFIWQRSGESDFFDLPLAA